MAEDISHFELDEDGALIGYPFARVRRNSSASEDIEYQIRLHTDLRGIVRYREDDIYYCFGSETEQQDQRALLAFFDQAGLTEDRHKVGTQYIDGKVPYPETGLPPRTLNEMF